MKKVLGVNEKFDMEDNVEPEIEIELQIADCNFNEDVEDDIQDDYKFCRTQIRYAIEASKKILEASYKDVVVNPSARGVEGCAAILKMMNEGTASLMMLHEKAKKVAKPKEVVQEEKEGIKTTRTSIEEIMDVMNNKDATYGQENS